MPIPVPAPARRRCSAVPIGGLAGLVGLAACVSGPSAGAAPGDASSAAVVATAGLALAGQDAVPLAPGSDLPPGIDLAAVEGLLGSMPTAIDWADVDPDPRIPTPLEVMGHAVGDRFTRHHQLVDWCTALAAASPRVTLEHYGTTNQGRPLMVLVITSPANHARLDEILAANARLADPRGTSAAEAARIAATNPAISWLSYNVHGNEASCTEASILVSHRLAAGRRPEITAMLDESIVVIDPCINPDGRERYVSFFQQRVGDVADPFPAAMEHREPWPSGRPNHYLFDLNRDWVWGTQVESRQRLPIYRRFMPQLHVDVHEQGVQSPYFLGAGDTPYSMNIPPASRTWAELFGRTMGAAFDAARFVYATRERFDYLYPGYGKVLPVYHGAVGLLLEQAGHGRAGRAITVDDEHGPGLVLALRARAEHHATATLAAARTTAVLRREQLERFAAYFRDSMQAEDGAPAAWLLRPQTDGRPRADLLALCRLQGIEVRQLTAARTIPGAALEGFHPPFSVDEDRTFPAGSLVIESGQPMGRLARTLLERAPGIEDRDTYDITAWSTIPLFGLDGHAYTGRLSALDTEPLEADGTDADRPGVTGASANRIAAAVGLLIPDRGQDFTRVLADAARRRLFARLTDADILLPGGTIVPRGSLLAHVVRNDPAELAGLSAAAAELGMPTILVDGSIPDAGPALGNNAHHRFVAPRRIVVAGDAPTSSLSFGHLRHLLERRSDVPFSVVRGEDLKRLDWARIDVLVLPAAGSYAGVLGEAGVEALGAWLRGGGTIVSIGSASGWTGRTFLELVDAKDAPAAEGADPLTETPGSELHTLTFAEREARGVARRVPGALFGSVVDRTHPLAAGVAPRLAWHVFGESPMAIDAGAHVVARYADLDDAGGPWIGGAAGPRARRQLAGTAAVAHHAVGRGTLVRFHGDPTNRGMNRAGMDLLVRAVLLGPSLAPGRQPLGDDHEHAHAGAGASR